MTTNDIAAIIVLLVILFLIFLLLYVHKKDKQLRSNYELKLSIEQNYGQPLTNFEDNRAKWRSVIPEYRPYYDELLPPDYVVFDLETSGLDPEKYEIVEIGAIRYKCGEKDAEFHTYVKPSYPIPSAASSVNKITSSMVSSAPTFDEIRSSFLNFIGVLPLVAHNARFDVHFLQTELGHHIENLIIDTLKLSRDFFPYLSNHKLESLKKHFNIQSDSHHALDDCIVTAYLYQECQRLAKERWLKNRPTIDLSLPNDSHIMAKPQKEYYDTLFNLLSEHKRPCNIRAIFFKNQKDFSVNIGHLRLCKFVFQKSGVFIVLPFENQSEKLLQGKVEYVISNNSSHNVKIALPSPESLLPISDLLFQVYDDIRSNFQDETIEQ